MALSFGLQNTFFDHSEEFRTGFSREEKETVDITVALDGSGDFENIRDALQNIVDMGGTTRGGIIRIKEGTHIVENAITIPSNNVTMIGEGRSTILKPDTTGVAMISSNAHKGLHISNIYFLGDNSSASSGVRLFNGCTDCVIENCWFESCEQGVSIDASDHCNVNNCWFTDCDSRCITIKSGADNCMITNNHCEDSVFGISIQSESSLHGDYNIVSGNEVRGMASDGIVVQDNCDWNIITGNQIISNGAYGIDVESSADRTLIGHNIILLNSTGQIRDNGTNTVASNNIIT